MTRAQLLHQISSFELEQWAALYRLEAEEQKNEQAQQNPTS